MTAIVVLVDGIFKVETNYPELKERQTHLQGRSATSRFWFVVIELEKSYAYIYEKIGSTKFWYVFAETWIYASLDGSVISQKLLELRDDTLKWY